MTFYHTLAGSHIIIDAGLCRAISRACLFFYMELAHWWSCELENTSQMHLLNQHGLHVLKIFETKLFLETTHYLKFIVERNKLKSYVIEIFGRRDYSEFKFSWNNEYKIFWNGHFVSYVGHLLFQVVILLSGMVALLVNISIYWIIGKTSPLTYPHTHVSVYEWCI